MVAIGFFAQLSGHDHLFLLSVGVKMGSCGEKGGVDRSRDHQRHHGKLLSHLKESFSEGGEGCQPEQSFTGTILCRNL